MRRVALALVATVVALPVAADELPRALRERLAAGEQAAEDGDVGPVLEAVAIVASAGLSPRQRHAAAERIFEMGEILADGAEAQGAALDVFRRLERRLPGCPIVADAIRRQGAALVELGDPKAALATYARLVRSAPRSAPARIRAAWTHQHVTALRAIGGIHLAQKRPEVALRAYLDAEDAWPSWSFGGKADVKRTGLHAVQALIPQIATDHPDHRTAWNAALALAPYREVSGPQGRTERFEQSTGAVLRALATVFEARKERALGRAVRAAAARLKPRPRGYVLPDVCRERIRYFRVQQKRFAADRAALPGLERRAAKNDTNAQYALAGLLRAGRVVPADRIRAEALLRAARAGNHPQAIYDEYYKARDDPTRRRILMRAFEAGHSGVVWSLSAKPVTLTPKHRRRAQQLAKQGNAAAWVLLANDAVPPARRRALLLRAARAGDPRSFKLLAKPGKTPAARAEARFWRRCAALSSWWFAPGHWEELAKARGVWRTRLEAAAKRYPGAALELAWIRGHAEEPRVSDLCSAVLGALPIWTAGLHGPAFLGARFLPEISARDPRFGPAVLAALRTRPKSLAAQHLIAVATEEGLLGLPRDRARGLVLHRAKARAGRRLPRRIGSGLPGHQGEALELSVPELAWAVAASRRGDAWAEAYRGMLLGLGAGGTRDRGAARAAYLRAARGGSPAGFRGLARLERLLESASGAYRPEADAALRGAAKLGDTQALSMVARHLERWGRTAEAAPVWKEAAAKGDPSALFRVARMHLEGKDADVTQALPLLRRAAAGGSVDAYLRLLIVLHEHPKLRVVGDP